MCGYFYVCYTVAYRSISFIFLFFAMVIDRWVFEKALMENYTTYQHAETTQTEFK